MFRAFRLELFLDFDIDLVMAMSCGSSCVALIRVSMLIQVGRQASVNWLIWVSKAFVAKLVMLEGIILRAKRRDR